jgi:glycine/D-amino acid oxidase-like deaminating enzyme
LSPRDGTTAAFTAKLALAQQRCRRRNPAPQGEWTMPADDATTPFLAISPYVVAPEDPAAALASSIAADIAIIGGGYTGLTTALALRERGFAPIILERDFCGHGASGRNAGHLTPTICKDLPTAMLLFGKQKAARLAQFADFCVANAEQLIKAYDIACDYHQSGNIMTVVHPSQERRLRRATETARALGAHMHFVEPGEMRERGLPRAFLSGAMEELGGTLHPGKLAGGLRRAALERGIRIYENTAVRRIEDGKPIRLITDGGTVSAERLVIATNAYTPEIAAIGKRVSPLYISMFETEKLSGRQIAEIGPWAGREGIYTAHESMESFRLTAQRTIIGGSKDVQYFFDASPHNHGGDADARKMSVIAAFRDRFPTLADVRIAHAWAGWCGFTLNFMPMVGRLKDNPAYIYAIGFNGHGIAQATAMGGMIADMVEGKANPWQAVIGRRAPLIPTKTLRYVCVKSLLALFNGIDRRLDARLRSSAHASIEAMGR